MDADEVIREIRKKKPEPPRRRAAMGQWVKPAWAARKLAEDGWTVSDAVREVVSALKLHPPDKAFRGVRSAYYEVIKQDWKDEPK